MPNHILTSAGSFTDTAGHSSSITGSNGNDTVYALDGADIIEGYGGNDALYGGNDDDIVKGGAGSDTVQGDLGNDAVYGGDSDDVVIGNAGNDTVQGGLGNDAVYGGDNNDVVGGDAGDDTVQGGLGNDAVYGGDSNDIVSGNAGDDTAQGGQGNDAVYGGDNNDVVGGDAGDDTVQGGQGNDTVYGGDGNDHVAGNKDNDYVSGGSGNDFVFGDSGNDVVFGGGGDDYIETNEGYDRFADGGSGYDFISFTFLKDYWVSASDFKAGVSGVSEIGFAGATGGADGDILRGVGLVGFLAGGDGSDLIDGSAANSHSDLVGEINVNGHGIPEASVWLMGGRGNDILIGGAKNNAFFGGHDVALTGLASSTDMSRWMSGWGSGSTAASESIVDNQALETASSYCDVFVIGSNFTYNSNVTYAETYTDTIFDFQHLYDYLDFSCVDFTVSELLQDKVSVTRNGDTFYLGISYSAATSSTASSADIHFRDNNGNDRIVKLVGKSVSEIRNNAGRIFDVDADTVIDGVVVNAADDIFGLGFGKTVDQIDDLVLSGAGNTDGVALTSTVDRKTWNTDSVTYISEIPGIMVHENNYIIAIGSRSDDDPQSLGVQHDIYFDGTGSSSSLQHNIAGNDGQDILLGLGGNDSLHGDDQTDLLLGGSGGDNLEGNRGDDLMIGQSGSDFILGGFGSDLIDGGGEDDTIDGDFGNDSIYGNSGNDKIDGGAGNDLIYGDSYLSAGSAELNLRSKLKTWFDPAGVIGIVSFGSNSINLSVTIVEPVGATTTTTSASESYLFSYAGTVSGNDTLFGGYGNDTLHSSGGADRLMAGQGNDSLSSYGGNDTLRGGSGNDVLLGGDGSDIVAGDHGNDSLTGGNGTDSLSGGYGTDVFQFSGVAEAAVGTGRDAILDFLSGADDIDLGAIDANSALAGNQAFLFNATTARANAIWYVVSGTDVIVRGDVNGNTTADFEIALKGVSALVAGDFLL